MIRHTVPVCMEQYRRMFATTRIPGKELDNIGVSSFFANPLGVAQALVGSLLRMVD